MLFMWIAFAVIDGDPIEGLARGASDVGFRTVALPLPSGLPLWEVARRRPQFFCKYLALPRRKLRFQWDRARLSAVIGRANIDLAASLPAIGLTAGQQQSFKHLRKPRLGTPSRAGRCL